jgi:hypothetical protein
MMGSHAIGQLLRHLPDNLHGLWLEVIQLHNILKGGGFPLLPKSVVAKCLNANREYILQRNIFCSKTYYQYGGTANTPECFKDQRDSGISIPEIAEGFYSTPTRRRYLLS